MNKKIIFQTLLLGLVFSLTAQTKEEIELPDLTTVISVEQEEETLVPPDFSDVVDFSSSMPSLEPELPASEAFETGIKSDDAIEQSLKSVYAEGQIGGGYPANFIGDFMVSRIYGLSPFKLGFTHKSIAGFSGNPLSEGYSTADTKVYFDKAFNFTSMKLNINASYEDSGNGLQSKAEGISSVNQDRVFADVDYKWTLPKGFYLEAAIPSDFYFRYANLTMNSSVADWVKGASLISLNPELGFGWEGKGFSTSLSGDYLFQSGLSGALSSQQVSRGEFTLDFAWKNDYVKLYADAGAVLSTRLNGNSVIVPFTLGVNSALPVYFSDRKLSLSFEGGIDSYQPSVYELEKACKYTAFSFLPSETTDMYTQANVSIPLKASFTGSASVKYRKTLFGNNTWAPLYSDSAFTDGLYSYSSSDQETLFTEAKLIYRIQHFALSAGWQSQWLDLPVLENRQNLCFNLSVQGKTGQWGITTDFVLGFDAADKTPVLNFEGFVQVTPAVRLVLHSDDFLKLITATSRTYAGSYVTSGGTVTLMAKFLF